MDNPLRRPTMNLRSVMTTLNRKKDADDAEPIGDMLDDMLEDAREVEAEDKLAATLGTALDRIGQVVNTQGALLIKIADQAAKGPPPANISVDVKPAESKPRAMRVEIIRGKDNLISELVIRPIEE